MMDGVRRHVCLISRAMQSGSLLLVQGTTSMDWQSTETLSRGLVNLFHTQGNWSTVQAYEQHGGLAVSWDAFGSSGYQTRPPGGNLKSYWYALRCSCSLYL